MIKKFSYARSAVCLGVGMEILNTVDEAVLEVIKKLGKKIVIGTPLGAGKANAFLNGIYDAAKKDSSISLTILTALTLQKPVGKSELERRFLEPFSERVFGNYPDLSYELDRVSESLPDNIEVIEFYFPAGKFVGNSTEQQRYLSSNYTHVARDLLERGVNLICQQVCEGEIEKEKVYSLSCNPDITIDIAEKMKEKSKEVLVIGQVNSDLPFMYGESVVAPEFFDFIIDNRELDFKVFGPPKTSVCDADFMIGLHASTLVKDDGEIQIGIGSLGDALVYSLCLRQKDNSAYLNVLEKLKIEETSFPIISKDGDLGKFDVGLFAATEMFVDSFADLYKAKILKKKVYDSVVIQRLINENLLEENFNKNVFTELYKAKAIHHQLSDEDVIFLREFGILKKEVKLIGESLQLENGELISANISDPESLEAIQKYAMGQSLRNGAVAHAGFFLGPTSFYQFLKDLPVKERKLIRMRRISRINQLYGHEEIDRLQRKNGRFINTCLKVTLNGSACSDTLDDLSQISGVGGQYNFVAMAHALPDARSVLQLRSFRLNKKGKAESNIVFNYGNCTIPRHLRDVVVTEYGIADLRAKTDEEVAIALIQIADSRFQESLLQKAKAAGKIRKTYNLPDRFSSNFPTRYKKVLANFKKEGLFPAFPFGSDFTEEELLIAKTLKYLKSLRNSHLKFLSFAFSALWGGSCPEQYLPLLKRMKLEQAKGFKEVIYQKLLVRGFKKRQSK